MFSICNDSMLDSSLQKQLEMSLLLGTVWYSHRFKPWLNTLSWKSAVTRWTLFIFVQSSAGFWSGSHTDTRVNTQIGLAYTVAAANEPCPQKANFMT